MAVFVTEHQGGNNYRQPINQMPLVSYFLSSTTNPATPQSGTKYIRVSADAASFLALGLTSSTTALTSTNSFRVPANAPPELFSVSTSFKIQATST